jgi:prepilin-type N-terminal cleavage/methylation domain-containing protein/prepilin-type processing-associated H-X9-DG protein
MNKGTNSRNTTRSAFTLVELLVVIAIMAVLVAIAFPLVGKMRERGLQAKCAGNLKNIYAAWGSYTADNSGRLPPALSGSHYWTRSLGPYLGFENTPDGRNAEFVGTVAFCPGNKGKRFHTQRDSALSYIPNGLIGGVFNSSGALIPRMRQPPNDRVPVALNIATIDQPSKRILFASQNGTDNSALSRSYLDGQNPGPFLATHFNGGGNILFADGHVELFKPNPTNANAGVYNLILGPGN